MNARYVRPVGERSSSNLAATKLRPPAPPARLVDRARLGAVLDEADAADVPLVLVSAPAGSGKSTLVAGWAAAHGGAVAWLQLEESDADPARFWVSVIAAIGRTNPEIGARLEPLVAGSLGAGQVVVPALVNELASLTERLVVVLDDYHLIDDAEVHRGMERLIDLCPPQLTLVLITRADPPFRLGPDAGARAGPGDPCRRPPVRPVRGRRPAGCRRRTGCDGAAARRPVRPHRGMGRRARARRAVAGAHRRHRSLRRDVPR